MPERLPLSDEPDGDLPVSEGTPPFAGGAPSVVETPPLSAFSIVKNASVQEYPVEAALRSVLPICDELVINVGYSEDDTRRRIEEFADGAAEWLDRHAEVLFGDDVPLVKGPDPPSIRILERDWGPEEGRTTVVHSEETNWAMERCEHDWALYVQADEVLHERDFGSLGAALSEARRRVERREAVEGLLFDYRHFYGSPGWELRGRRAYRREVRLVRRSSGIRSVGGAQGFGVDGRRPRVLRAAARVFHYGYARSREALTEKLRLGARYAGRDDGAVEPFVFRRHPGLERFEGRHPLPAREWLEGRDWEFDPAEAEPPPLDLAELKVRLSDSFERWTGRRPFEHRNYELIG